MISHAYTLLCRESFVDTDTNNAAIIPFEEFSITGELPDSNEATLGVNVEVYSLWTRDSLEPPDESAKARIRFLSPSGEKLEEKEITIPFQAGIYRVRARIRLAPFRYCGPGAYYYAVDKQGADTKWEEVARVPIRVQYAPQPKPVE